MTNKKLMVYAGDFALQDRVAHSYGFCDTQRQLDWSQFMAKVHQHIESLKQSYLQQLQKAGIELMRTHAAFVDAHTVEFDGRKVTADKILIAVEGAPSAAGIGRARRPTLRVRSRLRRETLLQRCLTPQKIVFLRK